MGEKREGAGERANESGSERVREKKNRERRATTRDDDDMRNWEDEDAALKAENEEVKAENEDLESENEVLKSENERRSAGPSTSKKRARGNDQTLDKNDDDDVGGGIAKQQHEVAEQNQQQQQNKKAGLPDELWAKILEDVDDNSVTAFASVSKQLKRVQKESRRWLRTSISETFVYNFSISLYNLSPVSEDWCRWSMKFLTEAKEGEDEETEVRKKRMVVNAAAFSGHLKLLKEWIEPTGDARQDLADHETSYFAAAGGHLQVLKYAHEKGCEWDEWTCREVAAGNNRRKVLDYLIH